MMNGMLAVSRWNVFFIWSRSLFGLLIALFLMSSCTVVWRGQLLSSYAVSQIYPGLSRENVLLILGSPSLDTVFDDRKSIYYISSKFSRLANFMPYSEVERRIFVVYFDESDKVVRVARYGLKDGKVFDFISRKSISFGRDITILQRLASIKNVFAGSRTDDD